eukprot:c17629_g1_i2 orf=86-406(-)
MHEHCSALILGDEVGGYFVVTLSIPMHNKVGHFLSCDYYKERLCTLICPAMPSGTFLISSVLSTFVCLSLSLSYFAYCFSPAVTISELKLGNGTLPSPLRRKIQPT